MIKYKQTSTSRKNTNNHTLLTGVAAASWTRAIKLRLMPNRIPRDSQTDFRHVQVGVWKQSACQGKLPSVRTKTTWRTRGWKGSRACVSSPADLSHAQLVRYTKIRRSDVVFLCQKGVQLSRRDGWRVCSVSVNVADFEIMKTYKYI
jgi:hypothetical protein